MDIKAHDNCIGIGNWDFLIHNRKPYILTGLQLKIISIIK